MVDNERLCAMELRLRLRRFMDCVENNVVYGQESIMVKSGKGHGQVHSQSDIQLLCTEE